jgi:hypothetical protein
MASLSEALGRNSNTTRRVFLVLGFIVVGFPRPITKMEFGLDPSWMTAINVASSFGLVFGRDIQFAWGPLGFALAPVDYGQEGWIKVAVTAHLIIYLAWWLSMALVVSRMEDVRDELLFLTASLAASYREPSGNILILSVLGFLAVAQGRGRVPWSMVAGGVAGLALLVKFNVGVACASTVVAWSIVQAFRGPWRAALPTSALAVATLLGSLWLGFRLSTRGSSSDLASFLKYSLVIARDFSSQMSLDGPTWQLLVAASLVMAVAVYAVAGLALGWKGWDLAAVILPAVLLGYKSAISRQDGMHFVPSVLGAAAFPTILVLSTAGRTGMARVRRFVAALLLVGIAASVGTEPTRAMIACLGIAGLLGLWTLAPSHDRRSETAPRAFPGPMAYRLTLTYLAGILAVAVFGLGGLALPRFPESIKLPRGPYNLLAHLHLKSWLATPLADGAKRHYGLPPTMLETIDRAAIDGYPWEISLLIHHGLNWSPRFAFQSYQAYSPSLDERSSRHFVGDAAPPFVLYEHTQLDSEHPFIVDPATLVEIYRWYDFQEQAVGSLLLARRREPRWRKARTLGKGSIGFGERWIVPEAEAGPIILKARLELNGAGHLKRALHKIIPPEIRLEYNDGVTRDHRLVWMNTEEGFLVSDLPRELGSVRAMFEGGRGDRVRAVTFLRDGGVFQPRIDLEWLQCRLRD